MQPVTACWPACLSGRITWGQPWSCPALWPTPPTPSSYPLTSPSPTLWYSSTDISSSPTPHTPSSYPLTSPSPTLWYSTVAHTYPPYHQYCGVVQLHWYPTDQHCDTDILFTNLDIRVCIVAQKSISSNPPSSDQMAAKKMAYLQQHRAIKRRLYQTYRKSSPTLLNSNVALTSFSPSWRYCKTPNRKLQIKICLIIVLHFPKMGKTVFDLYKGKN